MTTNYKTNRVGGELWSVSGAGTAFNGVTSTTALETFSVEPTFNFTAKENDAVIYYICRIIDGIAVYCVSNSRQSPVHSVVSLRTPAEGQRFGILKLEHLDLQCFHEAFISLNPKTVISQAQQAYRYTQAHIHQILPRG